MIEFEHKLPAMNINGRHNGTYNNREIGFPSVLTTTDYKLGEFLHTLRSNIYADRALVLIDGKVLMCNKNWIRDHVHVMKGMKYFEGAQRFAVTNICDNKNVLIATGGSTVCDPKNREK